MKPRDESILFYAFRYALGRRTYAVSTVSEVIREHARDISLHTRDLMCAEIAETIANNVAGDACDVEAWRRVADALRAV